MNKLQKEKYISEVSAYFEKHDIKNLFDDLYEHLVTSKPQNPIKSIIKRLTSNTNRRIFIVGTPGCSTKEVVLKLAEFLGSSMICVGDLLNKEVIKTTDLGRQIEYYITGNLFVPDEIVISVLLKNLRQIENSENLLIEGFPKTEGQARFLIAEGLISDCFLQINFEKDYALSQLRFCKKFKIQF